MVVAKICYITASSPFGKAEGFITNEIAMLRRLGAQLLIVPRDFSRSVFHADARTLLDKTYSAPLVSARMLGESIPFVLSGGRKVIRDIVANSRNSRIMVKNLAVLPKAVHVAKMIGIAGVRHVHAHWGTTTSTMAYIVHRLTGIPWSLTLHRWDIREDNLLALKVQSARFVRCTSERGKRALREVIGCDYDYKIRLIYMGAECRNGQRECDIELPVAHRGDKNFVLAMPARFCLRKGHKFLIDACSLLLERGIGSFRCYLFGEGPLRDEVESYIRERGLAEFVEIRGFVPQDELKAMYKNGDVSVVVLPSFDIGNEEGEGMPVSLIDAMSCGIPVVSTDAGGTLELIEDSGGVVVKQRDALGIADAIESLMRDDRLRESVGKSGEMRVRNKFNLEKIGGELLKLLTAEV